jgi:D-xylose 1-dehydrogenase (NADP+, D-xylono-1,5-lactone-forming)
VGVTRSAVGIGVLSTARINRPILAAARASPAVEVVAAASRDEARARAYAAEHGIERAYGGYDALLADGDVEAVYISLPNALHIPWSIRALEAGKHVLCEKPLSPDPRAVEQAFEVAERADRLLMEAFMYRHHPQTKQLAELVAGREIGELRLVSSCFSFALTELANIRLSAELEGGSLMDVGCYCVSMSRLLAGEPERVYAEAVRLRGGVDVRFTGTLRFPGDVLAHFDCGFDLPRRSFVEAVGSDGSILVPDPWLIRREGLELCRGDEVEWIEVEHADRYQAQLENFAAAIRGEAEPLLGRDDAVSQARSLAALLRSAAEGHPREPGSG